MLYAGKKLARRVELGYVLHSQPHAQGFRQNCQFLWMTRFYFNKDDNIYENSKILILFYKSKQICI